MHNYLFHSELINAGVSSIAFDTILARLDRTCFRCVLGMSIFRNDKRHVIQKVCTIYLNTVQDIAAPRGPTPVPFFEPVYKRRVQYEPLPPEETLPPKSSGNPSGSPFPIYFIRDCHSAYCVRKQMRSEALNEVRKLSLIHETPSQTRQTSLESPQRQDSKESF